MLPEYSRWIFILVTVHVKAHLLHIGALFDSASDDQRAAQLAVNQINQYSKQLFQGRYQLKLLFNYSQCDPVYAVDAFFHAIFRRPQLLFLIGTSCSNETKAVIQVAQYYNLILFSHTTSFISHLNQSYSTLVRLSVSDENHNDARVAWIHHNRWSNVAIIHQDTIDYSLMMAELAKCLNESNINVIFTQSVSMKNLTSALRTLQDKKARIVFVGFDTGSRARFFCEVYRTFAKELRERYVWILTDNDHLSWNFQNQNCTRDEILQAARYHVIIDSSFEHRSTHLHPAIRFEKFQEKNRVYQQTLNAYDAVMAIAALIRASIGLKIPIETFSYESNGIRDQWFTLLEKIHFLGASGPVSFHRGQRKARTLISQFDMDGVFPIAKYSQSFGLLTNCSQCRSIRWPGLKPIDTERSEIRRMNINLTEKILISASCLLGLILAIFFLTFNILHRHERYIKLSSPKLNNVMVIGAIHMHISCFLFVLDSWFLDHQVLSWACMLRISLFSGGFSLTFGSMFLKTLRVHRIFTSRNRPLLHSKLLQDHYLLLICFYLYVIDLICAVLWQYFDPHTVQFIFEPIRRLDMDTVVRNEIYYCDSRYRQKILPLIYVYKSLFLVMGGYLAAKTRHVHIAALNDSKFIVWSIYVVVLTSLFTALLMISMKTLYTLVLICFIVILTTSSILCLVFLPKVIRLRQHHPTMNEIIYQDLFVDDSRTRRFIVEISCFEKFRYAQLQNRELKSELIRLTHIVDALENKLNFNQPNVALALLPIAVRWASNLLHKPESSSSFTTAANRSASKAFLEQNPSTIPEETEDQRSTSSKTTCTPRDPILIESSSNVKLSTVNRSIDSVSSLALSYLTPHDEIRLENPSTRPLDDEESAVYFRVADELLIDTATFDSDFESSIDH